MADNERFHEANDLHIKPDFVVRSPTPLGQRQVPALINSATDEDGPQRATVGEWVLAVVCVAACMCLAFAAAWMMGGR